MTGTTHYDTGAWARMLRAGAVVVPLLALFVLVSVFFVWPLLEVLLRSLSPDGVLRYSALRFSLVNYQEIFATPFMRTLVWQTIYVSSVASVVSLVCAFPVAYLMSRTRGYTTVTMIGAVILGFFSSIVVRLFGISELLKNDGVVNQILGLVNLGPYSLLNGTFATTLGMANYLIPISILMLYSAMVQIDHNILLAARTLGAKSGVIFTRIYLPQIRSTVLATIVFCFILASGFFLVPAILGGTHNITIPLYIEQQVTNFRWGRASAVGILLLAVTIAGYYVVTRLSGGSIVGLGGSGGKGISSEVTARRSGSMILLSVFSLFVGVIVLSPLIVVVASSFNGSSFLNFPPTDLTLRWYVNALTDPGWSSSIWKSVRIAVGVGLLGTALGLLLVRLRARVETRWLRDLIGVLAFMPLVVPSILMGIGVFSVEARIGLLETDIGLILPQAILTLPYAYAILEGALGGGTGESETAAWTLGASRLLTFWTVVVPRIIPSLIASFALCAVISWDEIMVSLFQTGFSKTLPVLIYSSVKSGATPTVAAVATIMIAAVCFGLILFGIYRLVARPAR